MSFSLCGKVIHFNFKSADVQADELAYMHGKKASSYICKQCTKSAKCTIWHVGYGYDSDKLSKRARRQRKQASARKRKRKRQQLAG